MNSAKGYYCLIQYCPDLGRLESANVGVLLFCPERLFLEARLSSNNRRIIQFFGREGHDWARINSFKKGIEERLQKESAGLRTLEDLERFIALQANTLLITPPRPIKVREPSQDLERLACEFLGLSHRQAAKRSLRGFVQDRLIKAGLEAKIQTDIRVEVPVLRKEVEVPFGYQNGRFNLLTPVSFTSDHSDQSEATASKYAVRGESLYESPPHPNFGSLRFCVIGQFRAQDQETPRLVKAILERHHVGLYRTDNLPQLIDEIRRTGKDIPTSNDTLKTS